MKNENEKPIDILEHYETARRIYLQTGKGEKVMLSRDVCRTLLKALYILTFMIDSLETSFGIDDNGE